jgi:hypothetical protein
MMGFLRKIGCLEICGCLMWSRCERLVFMGWLEIEVQLIAE